MMFPRRLTWIWLALAILIGEGATSAEEKATPAGAWVAKEFPLVAWGGPPRAFNTAENWKILKDANFTLAFKSLVVGLFENPGNIQYALIANADPNHAVDFAITLHPEVKSLSVISPADGAASPVELKGNQTAYRLEAGDGRLFRLETKFKYPEPKKVEP